VAQMIGTNLSVLQQAMIVLTSVIAGVAAPASKGARR
jgi:Na+/H+-dicarboxylate symporter